MICIFKQIKVVAIFLLILQLCLPVYGPAYFSELLHSVAANHAGFVCAQADSDSEHGSRERPEHIVHCHELDEPGIISSGPVMHYSPVIAALTLSDKGVLLPGFSAPIEIPPEKPV